MKKSNLIKVFSILFINVMIIMLATRVFAADNNTNGFSDLTSTISNTNSNGNSNPSGNATPSGNGSTGNTNINHNKNNTPANNPNGASIYNNNNDLPKTGIEDSMPVALLLVIFGVSAIYAYKKIKDYRNI